MMWYVYVRNWNTLNKNIYRFGASHYIKAISNNNIEIMLLAIFFMLCCVLYVCNLSFLCSFLPYGARILCYK